MQDLCHQDSSFSLGKIDSSSHERKKKQKNKPRWRRFFLVKTIIARTNGFWFHKNWDKASLVGVMQWWKVFGAKSSCGALYSVVLCVSQAQSSSTKLSHVSCNCEGSGALNHSLTIRCEWCRASLSRRITHVAHSMTCCPPLTWDKRRFYIEADGDKLSRWKTNMEYILPSAFSQNHCRHRASVLTDLAQC